MKLTQTELYERYMRAQTADPDKLQSLRGEFFRLAAYVNLVAGDTREANESMRLLEQALSAAERGVARAGGA